MFQDFLDEDFHFEINDEFLDILDPLQEPEVEITYPVPKKQLTKQYLFRPETCKLINKSIPMKKLILNPINRKISQSQNFIKGQRKLQKSPVETSTSKKKFSTQSLKLFFMSTRDLKVNSLSFINSLKYFKRLENLTINIPTMTNYFIKNKIINLKRILFPLKTLVVVLYGPTRLLEYVYNNKDKSLLINHDFLEIGRNFKLNQLKFFIPRMKELIVSRKYSIENYWGDPSKKINSMPELKNVFSQQNHLKSIFINSEKFQIPYDYFKSLMLKYRPYCEILNPKFTDFEHIIQENLPFDFYFIQKENRVILNMDQKSIKIPHVLIANVPAKPEDLLYAQTYVNGEKHIYVFPNVAYVHNDFFMENKHDCCFYVLDDGICLPERIVKDIICNLNLNSPHKQRVLKMFNRVKSLSVSFRDGFDLYHNIIRPIEWMSKLKYMISCFQALRLTNFMIAKEPIILNKIFDFIF